MLLTKNVYSGEFSNERGPFGFRCGQMRASEFIHNGGWYNSLGEKIGWGDLTFTDIKKIAAEIPEQECFITLGEHDSFWNFVKKYGSIGSLCETEITCEAPGVEYVAEHARTIISRDTIVRITLQDTHEKNTERLIRGGEVLDVTLIERHNVLEYIQKFNK